ncbi:hypothetical protein WA577_004298, partial [Blastocystis sp. JDR]
MSQKTSDVFKPVARELIFDIDMDDYSPIRHCCTGANICRKCWPFMMNAMKVMKYILKERFGFKQLLFVFSGRRGVHIWVCDKRARQLTDAQRKAIVDYISFSKTSYKVDYNLHECAKMLRGFFERDILGEDGQDVLRYNPALETAAKKEFGNVDLVEVFQKQRCLPLVECLPSNFSRMNKEKLTSVLKSDKSAMEKWEAIQKLLEKDTIDKVILTFTFPRLDKNVSLLRHHLLKSPFIVHPKSCRFCCPIDPDRIEEFDPFSVPCLDEVFESEEALKKYNEYVAMFREKFLPALKKECCIEDGKARGEEANE